MSKLVFKTLKLEGFGNIRGLLHMKLDEQGLNIISGKNGAGKTTRFSGLSWTLYGVPLKKDSTIETWEHLRTPDWSGTMGSVTFYKDNDKFKVIRCRDYKKAIGGIKGGKRLIFEKNNAPYEVDGKELKDKKQIQQAIDEVLGVSHSLFINSVVFPQKATRFIEEAGPTKKAILEESFKLGWISKAADIAKLERKEIQTKLDIATSTLRQKLEAIADLETLIKDAEDAKAVFDADRDLKVQKLDKELKDAEKELTTLTRPDLQALNLKQVKIAKEIADLSSKDQLSEREELLKKEKLLLADLTKVQTKLGAKKLDLGKLKVNPETADAPCPFCGKPMGHEATHNHRMEAVQAVEELTTQKNNLSVQADAIGRKVLASDQDYKELVKARENQEAIRREYNTAVADNSYYVSIEKKIKDLTEDKAKEANREYHDVTKPLKVKLFTLTEGLETFELSELRLRTKRNNYDWVIKDPLSNGGIKAFLFDQLLDRLNIRLKFYERLSGFGVNLSVDLQSGRKNIDTIITKEGAPVDYRDLSGGESQLVNTMVALASGDVLLSENTINLRVYDELAEHLDSENVELLANLLSNLALTHCVYVITHNDQYPVMDANRVEISKP